MAENEVPHQVTVMPDELHFAKFTDTVEIDQEAHLLYMGDNWAGGIDVYDISTTTPKYVTTVKFRGMIYGVCVAKSVKKLYVGQTTSLVRVIDIDPESPKYHTVIETIDTGGRAHADLLDFDPVHEKIYIANRNDGFMTAIDAKTDRIVARIEGLGGGLEQPRFNPVDGMVYLCGNVDNVLYQIDPVTDRLVATFDIVDACHPNGMAINPETNQAILACGNGDNPHTVIWDFSSQSVAEVFSETGDGDGAAFSAVANRFFFAADGFTGGPVMGIFSANPVKFLGNVPTRKLSGWVAYDESNSIVYAPTVEKGKPALLSFPLPDYS